MATLGSNHCGNGTWLITMFSLIGSNPHITHCSQSKFSGGLIVINFLREDSVGGFEAIGVEWWSGAVIIIRQYKRECVLCA